MTKPRDINSTSPVNDPHLCVHRLLRNGRPERVIVRFKGEELVNYLSTMHAECPLFKVYQRDCDRSFAEGYRKAVAQVLDYMLEGPADSTVSEHLPFLYAWHKEVWAFDFGAERGLDWPSVPDTGEGPSLDDVKKRFQAYLYRFERWVRGADGRFSRQKLTIEESRDRLAKLTGFRATKDIPPQNYMRVIRAIEQEIEEVDRNA